MEILPQILLNVSVLVFGSILMLPISSRMNTPLYISLAWFCGWATIVISEMLLVMAGVYVTIPMIAGCAALCVIVLWIVAKNSITKRMVFWRRETQQLNWRFAAVLLLLLCVLVFILLAYFGNYIFYSADSVQIEGISQTFHKYGVYGYGKSIYDGQAEVLHPLFTIRLPFYVAILNVAYLCGIEVFYSFMGATTFFTCLALWGFWRGENDQLGFLSPIWFLLVLALFLSNRMVLLHSFYTHTNLTTMAYYTLGILSLYEYFKKKDNMWFMLACFLLGSTGILRIEMLLFSLLPFCFVAWKKCLPKLNITLLGFVLYFLISYLWFSWGFLGLLGISEAIGDGFESGGLLSVAFCFLLSLIIFFFPWQITNKRVRVAIYVILSISALFFIWYFNNKLITSWNALYLLTVKGAGNWGSFWWLLFWGVCIYALLRILPVLFKTSLGEITVHLKADKKGMEFLVFVPMAFLITRIVLYSMGEIPVTAHWYSGGNRILLHIYPVSVYFLGRVGFICSKEITKWKS